MQALEKSYGGLVNYFIKCLFLNDSGEEKKYEIKSKFLFRRYYKIGTRRKIYDNKYRKRTLWNKNT